MKKSNRYATRYTAKLKKAKYEVAVLENFVAIYKNQIAELKFHLENEKKNREPGVTTIRIGKAIAGLRPHILGVSLQIDMMSFMYAMRRKPGMIDISREVAYHAREVSRNLEQGMIEYIQKEGMLR